MESIPINLTVGANPRTLSRLKGDTTLNIETDVRRNHCSANLRKG